MVSVVTNQIAAISILWRGHCLYIKTSLSFPRHSIIRTTRFNTVNTMEDFYCIACSEVVTTRQEALLCDGCDRWQHRRCNTGITREAYRKAVRDGVEIAWTCLYCTDETALVPVAESTMIDMVNDLHYPQSHSQTTTFEENLSREYFL